MRAQNGAILAQIDPPMEELISADEIERCVAELIAEGIAPDVANQVASAIERALLAHDEDGALALIQETLAIGGRHAKRF